MRECFRGWKRKLGVLTLLLACLLAAGWMRSRQTVDTVSYCPQAGQWHFVMLSPFGIEWLRTYGRESNVAQGSFMNLTWNSENVTSEVLNDLNTRAARAELISNWEAFGFQFAVMRIKLLSVETSLWRFPYWAAVVPFTVLSVWLLLSKPGERNRLPVTGENNE